MAKRKITQRGTIEAFKVAAKDYIAFNWIAIILISAGVCAVSGEPLPGRRTLEASLANPRG
jgi:hypothetical protein